MKIQRNSFFFENTENLIFLRKNLKKFIIWKVQKFSFSLGKKEKFIFLGKYKELHFPLKIQRTSFSFEDTKNFILLKESTENFIFLGIDKEPRMYYRLDKQQIRFVLFPHVLAVSTVMTLLFNLLISLKHFSFNFNSFYHKKVIRFSQMRVKVFLGEAKVSKQLLIMSL